MHSISSSSFNWSLGKLLQYERSIVRAMSIYATVVKKLLNEILGARIEMTKPRFQDSCISVRVTKVNKLLVDFSIHFQHL